MIDLYTGIIYKCSIPNGDVNSIIKQVETEILKDLGCNVKVQLNKACENTEELGIEVDDYYLAFFTYELKDEWTQEILNNVGKKIKDITKCTVKLEMQRTWEIVVK